jgi:hypothetical protein
LLGPPVGRLGAAFRVRFFEPQQAFRERAEMGTWLIPSGVTSSGAVGACPAATFRLGAAAATQGPRPSATGQCRRPDLARQGFPALDRSSSMHSICKAARAWASPSGRPNSVASCLFRNLCCAFFGLGSEQPGEGRVGEASTEVTTCTTPTRTAVSRPGRKAQSGFCPRPSTGHLRRRRRNSRSAAIFISSLGRSRADQVSRYAFEHGHGRAFS